MDFIIQFDSVLILSFQVDIGSSVNQMSVETLNELGIITLVWTFILFLKMAYHTRTKPWGELPQVSIIISIKKYRYYFIIYNYVDAIHPIHEILGRPWLIFSQAKEDWGKMTFILGWGSIK